jgi:hypothetical protein
MPSFRYPTILNLGEKSSKSLTEIELHRSNPGPAATLCFLMPDMLGSDALLSQVRMHFNVTSSTKFNNPSKYKIWQSILVTAATAISFAGLELVLILTLRVSSKMFMLLLLIVTLS